MEKGTNIAKHYMDGMADNGYYLETFAEQDRPPLSLTTYSHEFPVDRKGKYLIDWYNRITGALHSSEETIPTDGII